MIRVLTYDDDNRIERVTKKQTHLHTAEKKDSVAWRSVFYLTVDK